MKFLTINDILRHTYGLIEIRSLKTENNKSYTFKTKYSNTQYTGTFFELPYNEANTSDTEESEMVEANATEQCFAIEFDNEPTEKEKGLLKRIREKFAEHSCFVSLYNNVLDEAFEM